MIWEPETPFDELTVNGLVMNFVPSKEAYDNMYHEENQLYFVADDDEYSGGSERVEIPFERNWDEELEAYAQIISYELAEQMVANYPNCCIVTDGHYSNVLAAHKMEVDHDGVDTSEYLFDFGSGQWVMTSGFPFSEVKSSDPDLASYGSYVPSFVLKAFNLHPQEVFAYAYSDYDESIGAYRINRDTARYLLEAYPNCYCYRSILSDNDSYYVVEPFTRIEQYEVRNVDSDEWTDEYVLMTKDKVFATEGIDSSWISTDGSTYFSRPLSDEVLVKRGDLKDYALKSDIPSGGAGGAGVEFVTFSLEEISVKNSSGQYLVNKINTDAAKRIFDAYPMCYMLEAEEDGSCLKTPIIMVSREKVNDAEYAYSVVLKEGTNENATYTTLNWED